MEKKRMKDVQGDSEKIKLAGQQPDKKPPENAKVAKAIEQQSDEKPPEDAEVAKAIEQQSDEKPPEDATETKADEQSLTRYKIICRNKITKRIGGVDFTNGEGYTSDGYAASWFEAKDGYTVEAAE